MFTFIARRVGVSILVLIAASFIMYMLTSLAVHPLEDLLQSNARNRAELIEQRTVAQHLDVPVVLRWLLWLGGVGRCIVPIGGTCDLGTTFTNQPVTELLPVAMASTLQLITASFILAIILGIVVGMVTALRANSGFDFTVTLASFFLYSLPSFLMAVLLKAFIALGYNDFLADPVIPLPTLIVIAIVLGLVLQLLVGGRLSKRIVTFAATAVISAVVLGTMSALHWFTTPMLGPVVLPIIAAAIGFGIVVLLAGLKNRRAYLTAAITVLLGIVSYFALQWLLNISTLGTIVILALVAVIVGGAVGFFVGGYDRGLMVRIGALTAFFIGSLIFIDRLMRSWPYYMSLTGDRPIATVGSQTPGLPGDFWTHGLDTFTHLLLPTISLLLISFAGYTRYARAGMLEVLEQDYVRTARAKGLPERTVIVRHAFRNMLIPLTTLVATDVGALLGGAVITEAVFAISGMGALFNSGLAGQQIAPVMGYFLVIAITVIFFNFVADLAYSVLDPRVRLR
ncbi:ABC transporter permease [Galbitalea sp. SE-J8]|uniref:ABC transporter permease n=1 Tax=Galbitalea sp. SE-J8 TaxID=3054952 RepID=UPI00259D06AD|nr:ABC transporter permease [Galbitalea sp. SE-J8]MDM4763353.1 ABC transporter permease [Galbitalea sp. SE-J8]